MDVKAYRFNEKRNYGEKAPKDKLSNQNKLPFAYVNEGCERAVKRQ